MKFAKRITALLLALLLVTAVVPVSHAATSDKSVAPDTTVTLYFTYSGIFGVDGTFAINDPDNIVKSWKVGNPNAPGMSGNISGVDCYLYTSGKTNVGSDVSIPVVVTISTTAVAGQSATISFNYALCTDGVLGTMSAYKTDTAKVTIEAESGPVEEIPLPDNKDPNRVDYSDLERQIAIANGLNQSDYTSDSWAVLQAALVKAEDTLANSKNQDDVDAAAEDLAEAIFALVKMDYSKLEAALAAVEEFADSQEIYDLWLKLADAVTRGKQLLSSGDQAAVDAAAEDIRAILAQLMDALSSNIPSTGGDGSQSEVVVPPEEDFCNIPLHKVWPVLFFMSLAVNVGLIALIVIYVAKRKKNMKDDTPMVDYDIDDDF